MPGPLAQKRTHFFEAHGDRRHDPYAWLKDEGWQQVLRDPSLLNSEIRTYLDEENRHTNEGMASTEELQKKLIAEMRGRMEENEESLPLRDGEYEYYVRYRKDGEHLIFCRKKNGVGLEEILFDGDKEAEGHSFFEIGMGEHSPNHRFFAYTVDTAGSEFFTIRVKDLESGAVLSREISGAHSKIVWANDSKTLFYLLRDENSRPKKVYRHEVGSMTEDVLVFEEMDETCDVGLGMTENRKFITITASRFDQSEVHLLRADAPRGKPFLVAPRLPGEEYAVDSYFGNLVILTNGGGAHDFKIMLAPEKTPGRESWSEFIPDRRGRHIVSLTLFKGFMVRLLRENALPRIVITDMDDYTEHELVFSEEAYDLQIHKGYEFDTEILRFSYSSPTTPEELYDYNMSERTRVLRKTEKIPSGHDPKKYTVRRIYAESHDGKKVPVTLVYRADTIFDGKNPLLLYGYGSYGSFMSSAFIPNRLSLVDRGLVCAWAHVRGGGDCGREWYLEGKLNKKKNTFLDFIACAEYLVKEKFTSPERMVAFGGSAGGMLMGVVANMRPDLFHAIVAEVPFVDVVTTICDPSLPLTPPEWYEWGNPLKDAEIYHYMKSYSPYDNVRAQSYPHILVTTGLTDFRVTDWEPAKWVAKLRSLKTDAHKLFLKVNMGAGHAGVSGRYDSLKEVAFCYAFVLDSLGIEH